MAAPVQKAELETRKVSLHERFSVARRNAGFPHCVTILVAYPSPAALPSLDKLRTRIDELQNHFSLLNSTLEDQRTRTPYFKQRPTKWSPADILEQRSYTPGKDGRDKEVVFWEELLRAQASDISTHPLWQISIYTAQNSPEGHPAYLTLSVDHTLIDGKGDFVLLKALLADDISELPYEDIKDVARLEDSMDIIPGIWSLLPVIWMELIVPKLPTFIGKYFKALPSWPANLSPKRAIKSPEAISFLELPFDLIASLKANGRLHGVNSLHPILKFSYAVAIWAVLGDTLHPFVLRMNTPGSVRNPALKHSYCTANYTSSVNVDLTASESTEFWYEASKAASYMRSPLGQKRALHSMGSLTYIPDPAPDPSKRDTERPTGWEDFFMDKALGDDPFMGSLNMSNVGHVDLPTGAIDLIWGQGASPFSPPFSISILGHSGGLRAQTVWRAGAPLTDEVVKQVEQVWVRVLERLADSKWSGSTFGDLVAEGDME